MTTSPAVIARVLEFRHLGWTYSQIANHMDLSRNQVAGLIYRAGETRDRTQSRYRSLDPAFKNQVAKAEGGAAQVAKRWGVSLSSVYEWRRGLGVRKDSPLP